MRLPIYQIDAFADRPFAGNPAAVMPLGSWLPDDVMQSIARENNLAETAFLVEEPGGWRIRWFTPECEIDLCGHATLATAHVLFEHLTPAVDEVWFASLSGPLGVRRLAVGADPADFDAHFGLAELLVAQGRTAQALPHLQAAAGSPDPGLSAAARARLSALR